MSADRTRLKRQVEMLGTQIGRRRQELSKQGKDSEDVEKLQRERRLAGGAGAGGQTCRAT